LTNNSVQKYALEFTDNEIEGCMIEKDQFYESLNDMATDFPAISKLSEPMRHIDEQIKRIIQVSIKSGIDAFEGRNNSFETLGYDMMIDADMNVWLLEINRSPDLTHSTHVTKKFVNNYFKDLVGLFNESGWQNVHKINQDSYGCLKKLIV